MNHLKQVTWIQAAEKRIADLERAIAQQDEILEAACEAAEAQQKRIEALEAKRGPGRPKVERDTAGNDRKV
jgi:predicted  nucleic acid-binding Zn-ribbon protein